MSSFAAGYSYAHDVQPQSTLLPQGKIQVQALGLPSHSSTRPLASVTDDGKQPLRYPRFAGNPAQGMIFRERDLLFIYDPEYITGTPGIAAQAQLSKSTLVTGGPMSTHSTAHMSMPYVFKCLNEMPIDVRVLCFGIGMETYDPSDPITYTTSVAIQQTNTIFNRSPYAFTALDYVMWEYPDPGQDPFGLDAETGNMYVPVLVPLKRRLNQMVGDVMLAETIRNAMYTIQTYAAQLDSTERKDTKQFDLSVNSKRPAAIMDRVLETAEATKQPGTQTYTWLKRLLKNEPVPSTQSTIDSCNLILCFAQDAFDMAMEIRGVPDQQIHEPANEQFIRMICLRNFINRALLAPHVARRIARTTNYDMLTALLDTVLMESAVLFNGRLIDHIRRHIVGICLSETKSLEYMDIYCKPGMFCTTSPAC